MVALPLPELPREITILKSLALDLRWTWSHEGDALWSSIDLQLWEKTHNPWVVLQSTSAERLKELACDREFLGELSEFVAAREQYLQTRGWFRGSVDASRLGGVAYFSMEFGLGAALPLYAGGLGVLAGDFLKAASDLDVPVIGIGLLYQEGYFRQLLSTTGAQQEFYPYNEPAAMPIEPVILPDDGWLRVPLELPGRIIQLRVWQVSVGRVTLYLLDSNDVLNNPADRGITAKLYGGGAEMRLMQEIVLGVGGWRVVEALHPEIEVCHVNEGHAAFAIIERARHLALKENIDFWAALWATRPGNIFTTHTPVAAGFDQFSAELLRKYLPYVDGVLAGRGVAQAAAEQAVQKVQQNVQSASDTASAKWNGLKAKIAADMSDLKSKVTERKHDLTVKRAANYSQLLDEEASFAIDYAIASIEQAKVAVLDAIAGRLAVEKAKRTAA